MIAASALGVNGTLALAEPGDNTEIERRAVSGTNASWIASGAAGAMLPPPEWNCERYVAEYRQFLADGNDADQWRFVGKRYRSDNDGQFYDWAMWLAWEKDAGCSGSVATGPSSGEASAGAGSGSGGGGFGGMTAVGTVIGVLGLGGAVAAGGGGGGDDAPPSKSPG